MATVLVVDDDRSVHHLVRRALEKHDLEVVVASDGESALSALQESSPDVVLLDIVLPNISGLELLQKLRAYDKRLPVIIITSDSDSSSAITAMQKGAFDYLRKPLDLGQLTELAFRAIETRRLMYVPVAIPTHDVGAISGDPFIGGSTSMLEVFKAIGRVAAQTVAVLIRGESGTGKELVARAVYQHSDRASECFLPVNCAAIPDNLLESELFGHEKGAFTGADSRRIGKFEQCHGGTIFLDEVGDMSSLIQGKVLRLVQQQQFERVGGCETLQTDVRLIAATNRNLEEMVEAGDFREDLLYRLNTVTIHLPPLRERLDDIPVLLEHFVSRYAAELRRPELEGISPDAVELLRQYTWPGNVRELQSVVRRAILSTSGTVIVPDFLPKEVRGVGNSTLSPAGVDSEDAAHSELPPSDLEPFVEQRLAEGSTDLFAECIELLERYLLTRVLQETDGNQSRAAELLGITRGKVRDRIAAYGIKVNRDVSID